MGDLNCLRILPHLDTCSASAYWHINVLIIRTALLFSALEILPNGLCNTLRLDSPYFAVPFHLIQLSCCPNRCAVFGDLASGIYEKDFSQHIGHSSNQ